MAETINLGIVGIKNCGEYNSQTTYEKLNVVTYEGSTYCALRDTVGNLPTNTDYWQLYAEKGGIGPQGPKPVKGVDYYTVEDKEEIKEDISTEVHNEVVQQVGQISDGTPLPAGSISDMTDTTKLYVLVTDGYVYYYNGTEWVQGWVYQSTGLVTDKTLSIENEAADAYYTGVVKDNTDLVFNKLLKAINLDIDHTLENYAIGNSGAITQTDASGQTIYYYYVTPYRNQKIKVLTETVRAVKYAFYRGSTQQPSTLVEKYNKSDSKLIEIPNNASYLLVVKTTTEGQPLVQTYGKSTDKTLSIENEAADAYYTGVVKNHNDSIINQLFTLINVNLDHTLENYTITNGGNIVEEEGKIIYYYYVSTYREKIIKIITKTNNELKYAFFRGSTQQPSTKVASSFSADGLMTIIPSNASYLLVVANSTEEQPTVDVYEEKYLDTKIKLDYLANELNFGCHQGLTKNGVHSNTLLAYYNAFKYGFSGIECDVRMTSDQVLVISHDGTVTDTSSNTYTISQITYSELMSLNLGYSIPTLKDVLRLIYLCNLEENLLEIKPDSDTVGRLISQLVYNMRLEDKVIYNVRGSSTVLNSLYIDNYRKVNFLIRFTSYSEALTYQSYLQHGRVMFSILEEEYGDLITEEQFNQLSNLGFEFCVVCDSLDEVYSAMDYATHIEVADSIKNTINLESIIDQYIENKNV